MIVKIYIACIFVLLLSSFYHEPAFPKKQYCADLIVDKIYKPEWDAEKHQSVVRVTLKNTGNTMSDSTLVRLREIDVKGYSDDLTLKPSIGSFGEKHKLQKRDSVWLDPMMPKEKRDITLALNYWVYDPDCELQVEIDTINSKECEKANNIKQFLDKGK
jgi:hypothetical protein